MAGMVFFTDNYQDRSSDDGYQFEFFCRRCGNGYSSSFQHSVTGFGGRLLRLGGDVVGGNLGERASQLGFDAEFMRSTVRGSTRDKALAKAVDEMKPYFKQCHNCGQWVCDQVCWNTERGLCVSCAPKLDQAMAQMQAQAQVQQLNTKIQAQDWTQDINYRDQATGLCPSCGFGGFGGSGDFGGYWAFRALGGMNGNTDVQHQMTPRADVQRGLLTPETEDLATLTTSGEDPTVLAFALLCPAGGGDPVAYEVLNLPEPVTYVYRAGGQDPGALINQALDAAGFAPAEVHAAAAGSLTAPHRQDAAASPLTSALVSTIPHGADWPAQLTRSLVG